MENKVVTTIIDEIYEMIQDARSAPLSANKCIIEREKALDLLDEIIAALPSEIKKARAIIASRDDLLVNAQSQATNIISSANDTANETVTRAQNEAEDIVAKAKLKAQEMVEKEVIYKEAEKQCKDMMDKTNAKITELRAASNKYIADSLGKAAEVIEASLKDVKDTRAKFASLTN